MVPTFLLLEFVVNTSGEVAGQAAPLSVIGRVIAGIRLFSPDLLTKSRVWQIMACGYRIVHFPREDFGMFISRRRLLAASPLLLLPSRIALAQGAGDSDFFQELTDQSERAVRRGTEWMMKTMHRDGGCGVDIGQPPDIGCTSMVGLALLSQGNTPVEGPRSREVRRIVSYLLKIIETMPSDDITPMQGTQLQNKIGRHAHSFFAALFLSQALGEGFDSQPVQQALKRVIEAITASQTPDGHWGNQSWAPTLGTVMGWISLRAAHFAGIKVGSSPDKTARHLTAQMSQSLTANGGWMHELYKHATGIRVLYAMGMEKEAVSQRAFKAVLELVSRDNTAFSQAGGEELLAFHLITETMLQKGGADWKTWFPVVRDKMVAVQNSDGSWTGHHCITSRTFCTAAASLVLTAPNRYLPISQP
jgi:hypothetical protein